MSGWTDQWRHARTCVFFGNAIQFYTINIYLHQVLSLILWIEGWVRNHKFFSRNLVGARTPVIIWQLRDFLYLSLVAEIRDPSLFIWGKTVSLHQDKGSFRPEKSVRTYGCKVGKKNLLCSRLYYQLKISSILLWRGCFPSSLL